MMSVALHFTKTNETICVFQNSREARHFWKVLWLILYLSDHWGAKCAQAIFGVHLWVVLRLSLRSAAPGALRVSDCCSGSPLRGALRSNTLITLDFFSCSDGNELSPYAKTNADQALNDGYGASTTKESISTLMAPLPDYTPFNFYAIIWKTQPCINF